MGDPKDSGPGPGPNPLPQGLGKPNLSLTERRFLETGIGTRGVRRKDKESFELLLKFGK